MHQPFPKRGWVDSKNSNFPMDVAYFFSPRSDLAFIGGYHGLVDLRVGEIDRIRAQAWGATCHDQPGCLEI